MTNKTIQAAKLIAELEDFFYCNDSGYIEWLQQNRNTGFVVNNFKNDVATRVWNKQLVIHKLPCISLPNQPDYKKSRTSYGKWCNLDEEILIEICNQLEIQGEYKLKSCDKCQSNRN